MCRLWLRSSLLLALLTPALLHTPVASAQDEENFEVVARAVVVRFYDAVLAADEQALLNLIFVPDTNTAQKEGRRLFVEMIAAQRRLEQTAIQRFGPAEGALLTARNQYAFTSADREALNRGVVLLDESGPASRIIHGKIIIDDFTLPLRIRRSLDGQWRVLLDQIDGRLDDENQRPFQPPSPPGGPQARAAPTPSPPNALSRFWLERYQVIIDAVNATADRIRGGQLPNASAACVELSTKVAAAGEDHQRKIAQYRQRARYR